MANRFSVDRVRFLAVAAALAGVASFQACTVNNNNTTDDNEAGEGNGGGNTNTGATSNSGGSGDEAGASATVGGSSGTEAGGGNVEGGSTGVVGGAASTTGGASEGGAGGGANVCDDSVGTPSCENVSEACTPYCAAAVANLKPAAAVAAIACLEADATCADGYKCLADATAEGCAEDEVEAACTAAMETCGEPDPGDPACSQLLSGFTDDARVGVISCMGEGCLSVYSCAEGFFFASE